MIQSQTLLNMLVFNKLHEDMLKTTQINEKQYTNNLFGSDMNNLSESVKIEEKTTDSLESLQKRVKIDEPKFPVVSQDSKLSPGLTAEKSIVNLNNMKKPVKAKRKTGSQRKDTRVTEMIYDPRKKKTFFKLVPGINSQDKKIRLLTREELVQECPKLLLNFYENYLKFPENPEFDTKDLMLP